MSAMSPANIGIIFAVVGFVILYITYYHWKSLWAFTTRFLPPGELYTEQLDRALNRNAGFCSLVFGLVMMLQSYQLPLWFILLAALLVALAISAIIAPPASLNTNNAKSNA